MQDHTATEDTATQDTATDDTATQDTATDDTATQDTATQDTVTDDAAGDDRIAVTVIGGYLGAGKTTLVNHILRTADEQVAVLVNDFGDVNIDEELVESEDGDTISLANGCICCSLVDGFAAALTTVRALDPLPRRLVIEASGVADPAMVAAYGHGPGLALDAVVVVVDAETVQRRSRDKYVGDTVLAQLRSADIIVLNKIDLVEPELVVATTDWLRDRAPDAVIVEADRARVAPSLLFGVTDADRSRRRRPSSAGPMPAPADDIFQSWSWGGAEPVPRERIERLMAELPETVVRVKGVLRLIEEPDRRMILQRVGGRWTLRPGPGRRDGSDSRLVVIGTPGAITDGWLERHLTADSGETDL